MNIFSPDFIPPRIPVGDWIATFLDFFVEHVSPATRAFAGVVETGIDLVENGLMAVPPPALKIVLALSAGLASRRWGLPVFALLGCFLILSMGFCAAAMATLRKSLQ